MIHKTSKVHTGRRKAPARPPSSLRQRREELQLSLRDVAGAVGCAVSAVYNWETGEREPLPLHRDRYAAALRLTVGDLGRIIYEGTAGLGDEA